MRVVKFGEHFSPWSEEDVGKEVILQYGFGTRVKAKIVAVPYMVTLNQVENGVIIGQSVVGNGELIIGPDFEIGQILAQIEYALPKIETQKMLEERRQEEGI